MSPWIIGFFAFILYPMAASLYFSFSHYNLLSSPQWAGLQNYRFMLTKDPQFWLAIRNTAFLIAVGVPIRIVFSVATAWLLTKPKRGRGIYRTIYFMPTMAPAVAATLVFLYLFNPVFGPVNQFLRVLHFGSPLWFFSPSWSKWGLIILGLWGVGDAIIIFLAGLLDVPRHLYEAADIEGATGPQKFRFVTLPMISPVIFFSLVIGVIEGFQYFTQAYVASDVVNPGSNVLGQPQGSTLFYGLWLYQQGFRYFHMGYASALAWILFLIILACTVVLIKTQRRWVHYQGGGFR
ncbi:MAG: sugar ABC transporter permease [Actinomycetota bacterium]|nr:sugar ABC transporter permease [Actinomycetota bacterium]